MLCLVVLTVGFLVVVGVVRVVHLGDVVEKLCKKCPEVRNALARVYTELVALNSSELLQAMSKERPLMMADDLPGVADDRIAGDQAE